MGNFSNYFVDKGAAQGSFIANIEVTFSPLRSHENFKLLIL